MRILIQSLMLLALVAFAVPYDAATVLQLNFDSAPVVNDATYDFGPGDIPSSGLVDLYFRGLPVGTSYRDYGLLWDGSGMFEPENYSDSGEYPDIVTPSTPGFQGGNALFTNLGTAADPTKHNGWYINVQNNITVSGSFTAEAIVMFATISPVYVSPGGTPPFGSEHGLQNVFGNEAIQAGKAMWKFRHNPISHVMELVTQNTVSGGEINLASLADAAAMTWYHLGAVYTAGTNTFEFFVNGASQGTISPQWALPEQDNWWVAEWPPNPATRGLAGWIDAVALSSAALAPNQFVLSYPGHTGMSDWQQY